MKYSILNFNVIDLEDRIDAEYFEPELLKIANSLKAKNSFPLSSYCTLTASAFYPAATDLYASGDIPFIRCVDCIDYPIITSLQNNSFAKIPLSFLNEYDNIKELHTGDIVITKVGTPCYASLIDSFDKVALSRTVLGVTGIKNIDPAFLTVFLRSKYGFSQLFRERELTIQYQLTLERVGSILVYKPKENSLEQLISKIFQAYKTINFRSAEMYSQAERILLSELGLLDWKPKNRLSFVRNYSDTQRAERIDAEYFQPEYDEVIKLIKLYKNGFDTLGNLVKLKNQNYNPDNNQKYKYIELANIGNSGQISDYLEDYGQDLPTRARRNVRIGDVIVSSIEGSLDKIALIRDDLDDALCSTGFHIIQSAKINSETLLCLMKSPMGYLQLKQGCSGTILTAINDEAFQRILLPIISKSVQDRVKQNISSMYEMQAQSKHLLETAKTGIEKAIEQNETSAINWIKQELLKHKVTL